MTLLLENSTGEGRDLALSMLSPQGKMLVAQNPLDFAWAVHGLCERVNTGRFLSLSVGRYRIFS